MSHKGRDRHLFSFLIYRYWRGKEIQTALAPVLCIVSVCLCTCVCVKMKGLRQSKRDKTPERAGWSRFTLQVIVRFTQ